MEFDEGRKFVKHASTFLFLVRADHIRNSTASLIVKRETQKLAQLRCFVTSTSLNTKACVYNSRLRLFAFTYNNYLFKQYKELPGATKFESPCCSLMNLLIIAKCSKYIYFTIQFRFAIVVLRIFLSNSIVIFWNILSNTYFTTKNKYIINLVFTHKTQT